MKCVAFILLITLSWQQPLLPRIEIVNTEIIPQDGNSTVMSDGVLNNIYDDSIFNNVLNCKNGDLTIIDNTHGNQITFSYTGLSTLNYFNSFITISPNKEPQPSISFPAPGLFALSFQCPTEIDDHNYYNKIDVNVDGRRFSFLLDCDPNHRHKLFQFGYLIITVMDAAILIGVSMYSRIGSLKIKGKQLRLNLRWFHSLILCIFGGVLIGGLYFFAFKDFDSAFVTVRYVGIGMSAIFIFICFNQLFYFISILRKPIYGKLRYLELSSFLLSSVIIVLSIFFQNWILYNFMAICICVSCIKLFHFKSLKEAYIFLGITVFTVTAIAIISHYILARSYNDYATQLSSPLFLQVPDLVNNLYKQCSWLPVVDVIFPGSMIAFLRKYDQNRSSRWLGVYTVLGNLTFILSTILWIGIEAVYPFSVPFSLVTYLCLMLTIFLFSLKRKEWSTLYTGNFQIDNQDIDQEKLVQKDQSFSDMISKGILDPLKKYKFSSISNSEHENQKSPQKQ